jgi:hypothetical protein
LTWEASHNFEEGLCYKSTADGESDLGNTFGGFRVPGSILRKRADDAARPRSNREGANPRPSG